MPDPKIVVKDGKQYVEAPGMGLIPVDELYGSGGPNAQPPSWIDRASKFAKGAAPEVVAGLTDALSLSNPWMAAAGPPVMAAVTDAARQYGDTGKVNWGEVAMRGASNTIPDVGERIGKAAVEAGDTAGKAVMGAVTHGPKGGILAGLKSMLGFGAAPAASAAPVASELSRMTLADGTKVLSSEGLKQLVKKSVELSNTKGTPPAQIQALDALIDQVRQAITPTNLSAADLLSKISMPTSTTDAIANAAAAATRKVKASKFGKSVNVGMRTALGLTQGALAEGSE